MMKRLTPVLFLMLALLMVSTAAFADTVAGKAQGAFGGGTPADSATLSLGGGSLKYTGQTYTGDTMQTGDLMPLGTFHLNTPFASGTDSTFKLHLIFSAPPSAPATDFTADVDAHIFFWTGYLTIDFADAPTTVHYVTPDYNGSFDLAIDDITLGTLVGLSCDKTLQADITNAVPEPAAILLLGSMLLGVGIWRKKRA